MKRDFSPEERLLKIIKSAQKKSGPKESDSGADNTEKAGVGPSPSLGMPTKKNGGKAAPKGLGAISLALPAHLKRLDFHTVNYVFVVILIGVLAFFIYDLFYAAYYRPYEPKLDLSEASKALESDMAGKLGIRPYEQYSRSIGSRNIFLPPQIEIEEVATGPSLDEVRASFSLLGIIAGPRYQAIIEDKRTGKSHFVYEKNSIGEATVVQIMEGSVVLEYKGQEFTLVL